uniref:Uncharacterized protein n=1 Tax=Bicosoecida sp. CB-2014 TaxID=1486930 RepID=A0A7S1C908_9STRA
MSGSSAPPSATEHSLAGMTASTIALSMTFPLDAIRSRLQADESEKGHRGPLSVLMEAHRSPEGLAGLYQGIGANLKIMAASQAVYFWWYNKLKGRYERGAGRAVGVVENLALAYIAGAINASLTCPLWAAALRLKLEGKKREAAAAAADGGDDGSSDVEGLERDGDDAAPEPGILSMLKTMVDEDGVRGLYKGLGPALVLCTNPAIQFLCYEQLRRRLAADRPTGAQAFMLGLIAKAVATVVTYPVQVMQVREQNAKAGQPRGFKLAASILKHEGVGGFYKGMSSKLLQTCLQSALLFNIYEKLLRVVVLVLRRGKA